MKYLRQSTAATVIVGPFLAKADAFTPVTGLTSSSTLNGRAASNGTGAAYAPASFAHDANGHYLTPLATGDVPSVGRLRLSFSDPATYLPVWEDFTVLSAAVYDSLFGTAALSVYAGGAVASVTAPVAVVDPEALTAVVVSATTTSVTASASGSTAFNATPNAYAGAAPPRFLTFTSGANRGLAATVTSSSLSGGNLTLGFAASPGVAAASAGDAVQID